MLHIATKRELLERLIVAELISKRGQGPLAPRHFSPTGRGPFGGVRRSVEAKRPEAPRDDVNEREPDESR